MSDSNSSNLKPPFLLPRPEALSLELTGNLDLTTCPVRVRYLLVSVDTFSRWVWAFPTTNRRLSQSLTSFFWRSFLTLQYLPLSSWTMALNSSPRFPKPYPESSTSLAISVSHTTPSAQERQKELNAPYKTPLSNYHRTLLQLGEAPADDPS